MSLLKKNRQSLLFFVFLSSGLHIGLFILLLNSKILWSVFQKDKKVFTPSAIRVDMVALPDLPSKTNAKNPKKTKPFTPSKKADKKLKQKAKKNKNLTKETVKKQDKQHSSSKETNKSNLSSNSKNTINKGNKLSKGTNTGKESLTVQEISEINKYATLIDQQIRSQWNLPKYLTDRDLTAKIEIRIDARGEITSKQLLKSSGNDLFDSRVLKATENSAPYPPPPPNVQMVIKDGIIFELSSRSKN